MISIFACIATYIVPVTYTYFTYAFLLCADINFIHVYNYITILKSRNIYSYISILLHTHVTTV